MGTDRQERSGVGGEGGKALLEILQLETSSDLKTRTHSIPERRIMQKMPALQEGCASPASDVFPAGGGGALSYAGRGVRQQLRGSWGSWEGCRARVVSDDLLALIMKRGG